MSKNDLPTNTTNDDVEEDQKPEGEEIIVTPWNPNESKIDTKLVTVDLIIRRLRENEIDLGPAFQRQGGIWSDQQKSWLIESMLIKIPLPMFYFDATDENKWIVIDGLQRLTTFDQFFLKNFKLSRLQYLTQFNGCEYSDLPRHLRRRIEETQITVNLVQPGTPDKVKFDIFRRINTGGLSLNAQEIRNALNQGPVVDLIRSLASSDEFISATSGSISSVRMNDQDFILRFLSFLTQHYSEYSSPDIDSFLNSSMVKLNDLATDYDSFRKSFVKSMNAAYRLFEQYAFRKVYSGDTTRRPINKSLFEAWSVALAQLSDEEIENLVSKKDALLQTFIHTLDNDKAFEKAISYGTQDIGKTRKRFSTVEGIIRSVLNA